VLVDARRNNDWKLAAVQMSILGYVFRIALAVDAAAVYSG
jgi:hypothetical protein